MTAKQIKATARQMRQLIDDARGVPRRMPWGNLTDDEFVSYWMDPPELKPEMLSRVEQHLALVHQMAGRMEHLLSISEAWRGPEGEKRSPGCRSGSGRFAGGPPGWPMRPRPRRCIARFADGFASCLSTRRRSAPLPVRRLSSSHSPSPSIYPFVKTRKETCASGSVPTTAHWLELASSSNRSVRRSPSSRRTGSGRSRGVIPSSARRDLAPRTVVRWRVERL